MPEGLLLQCLEGSDEKGQSLERQHEHPAMRDAGGELYVEKLSTNKSGGKGGWAEEMWCAEGAI